MTPTPVHTSGARCWLPRPVSLNPRLRLSLVQSWLPRPVSLNREPTLSRPHPNHQRTQGNTRAHAPRAPPRPPPRDATLRRRPAPRAGPPNSALTPRRPCDHPTTTSVCSHTHAQQQRHGPRDFKRVPYLQHATHGCSEMAHATRTCYGGVVDETRTSRCIRAAEAGPVTVEAGRCFRVTGSAPRRKDTDTRSN